MSPAPEQHSRISPEIYEQDSTNVWVAHEGVG